MIVIRDLYSENFHPAANRWKDYAQDDEKITYYSNPRIFSCRTERDDTIEAGELYRHLEDDDDDY